MYISQNPALEDRFLTVKAAVFAFLCMSQSERAVLEKLLDVRRQRYGSDHAALASVYEGLASSYLGYAADDLHKADAFAGEAERILFLHTKKGQSSFRIGKLVHLRCRVQQHLNHPHRSLELGEEALAIYNNSGKLLSHQRASLMHTLIHLHEQVGSLDRAENLATEVKAVDHALMSMSARRRF